jgi:putative DNA primase/helicase
VEGKTFVTLAKAATAAAVERFAQSDPTLAVTSSIWDNDPFLLGTPDGTLDLRTGILRAPNPQDFITSLTAVTPAPQATCPLWLNFLAEATGRDEGLIRFLQQWCGYCLTGDTREHALLFAHGPGGNGKGVFLNTVSRIMGDYARTAAMETFTASATDKHPTDLAMLRGARLVTASETEEGRAWAESRIKQMTGGDPIAARFMRQDFFEYVPNFKLTIIGNHKPVLRNVDEAARRRFNMVPFLFKPQKVDRQLEMKLRAEWPGILRWMIDGCLDWQKHGLIRPPVVINATAEYFSEQDTVSQWVEDCCTLGPRQSDTLKTLFKSWSGYAFANGEKAR